MKHVSLKIITLPLLCLLCIQNSFGQFNCFDSLKIYENHFKVNNGVGMVPSNARVTNGLGIGWSTSLDYCADMDSVKINGLYSNISPFQVIVAGMVIMMSPFALFSKETYQKSARDNTQYDNIYERHQINGASIGLFELGEEFTVRGVQITGLWHSMNKLNGVSLTSIISDYKHFNGVSICGIYNRTYKGRGVQIGLINKAEKLEGVQIGLWNIVGGRGFPLINIGRSPEAEYPSNAKHPKAKVHFSSGK